MLTLNYPRVINCEHDVEKRAEIDKDCIGESQFIKLNSMTISINF